MAHVHYSRREYAEHLLSDEWAALRDRAMEKSQGTCQFCKEAKATQVHHLTYRSITNVRVSDLRGVCDPCHGRIHVLVKRRKLRLDGWEHGDILFDRTIAALNTPTPSKPRSQIGEELANRIVQAKGVRRVAGILKVTIYHPEDIQDIKVTEATRAKILRLMRHPAIRKAPLGIASRQNTGKIRTRY